MKSIDLLIVGGGITGASLSVAAVERGWSTVLVDRADFASGTSAWSTKLLHGGLRYLAAGEWRLVALALTEKMKWMRSLAPNLTRETEFVYPFERGALIENLKVAFGASLYELLAYGFRARIQVWSKARLYRECPRLDPHRYRGAIVYRDAVTVDTRLVMTLLRTAAEHGVELRNYCQDLRIEAEGHEWRCRSDVGEWQAKRLAIAVGPWTAKASRTWLPGQMSPLLTLVQGSHLILSGELPCVAANGRATVMRGPDGRFMFLVPQFGADRQAFIFGTTEESVTREELEHLRPSRRELQYLFRALGKLGLRDASVTHGYSGVRPLAGAGRDFSTISREERIETGGSPPWVRVFGGKLTTSRATAERALSALSRDPCRRRITRLSLGVGKEEAEVLMSVLMAEFSAAPRDVIEHLIRFYGAEARSILSDDALDRLYPDFPITAAELRYLCRREWVRHLSDLLIRRVPVYFWIPNLSRDRVEWAAAAVRPVTGWSEIRTQDEVNRYVEFCDSLRVQP